MSLRFSPETAVLRIFGIGVFIETSQYFKIYDSVFDSYGYLAYASLLLPIYLLDKWLLNYQKEKGQS